MCQLADFGSQTQDWMEQIKTMLRQTGLEYRAHTVRREAAAVARFCAPESVERPSHRAFRATAAAFAAAAGVVLVPVLLVLRGLGLRRLLLGLQGLLLLPHRLQGVELLRGECGLLGLSWLPWHACGAYGWHSGAWRRGGRPWQRGGRQRVGRGRRGDAWDRASSAR